MKLFVVLFVCTAAAVLGAPNDAQLPEETHKPPALIHEMFRDDFGQFEMRYISPDGTIVSEKARLVPTADGKDHVLVYEGEFSFIGDDGKVYKTKYITDANGHQVTGDHLPKSPEPLPVPAIPELKPSA